MYKIHRNIELKEHHVPTEKTKHYLGDEEIPQVAKLQIISFGDNAVLATWKYRRHSG